MVFGIFYRLYFYEDEICIALENYLSKVLKSLSVFAETLNFLPGFNGVST